MTRLTLFLLLGLSLASQVNYYVATGDNAFALWEGRNYQDTALGWKNLRLWEDVTRTVEEDWRTAQKFNPVVGSTAPSPVSLTAYVHDQITAGCATTFLGDFSFLRPGATGYSTVLTSAAAGWRCKPAQDLLQDTPVLPAVTMPLIPALDPFPAANQQWNPDFADPQFDDRAWADAFEYAQNKCPTWSDATSVWCTNHGGSKIADISENAYWILQSGQYGTGVRATGCRSPDNTETYRNAVCRWVEAVGPSAPNIDKLEIAAPADTLCLGVRFSFSRPALRDFFQIGRYPYNKFRIYLAEDEIGVSAEDLAWVQAFEFTDSSIGMIDVCIPWGTYGAFQFTQQFYDTYVVGVRFVHDPAVVTEVRNKAPSILVGKIASQKIVKSGAVGGCVSCPVERTCFVEASHSGNFTEEAHIEFPDAGDTWIEPYISFTYMWNRAYWLHNMTGETVGVAGVDPAFGYYGCDVEETDVQRFIVHAGDNWCYPLMEGRLALSQLNHFGFQIVKYRDYIEVNGSIWVRSEYQWIHNAELNTSQWHYIRFPIRITIPNTIKLEITNLKIYGKHIEDFAVVLYKEMSADLDHAGVAVTLSFKTVVQAPYQLTSLSWVSNDALFPQLAEHFTFDTRTSFNIPACTRPINDGRELCEQLWTTTITHKKKGVACELPLAGYKLHATIGCRLDGLGGYAYPKTCDNIVYDQILDPEATFTFSMQAQDFCVQEFTYDDNSRLQGSMLSYKDYSCGTTQDYFVADNTAYFQSTVEPINPGNFPFRILGIDVHYCELKMLTGAQTTRVLYDHGTTTIGGQLGFGFEQTSGTTTKNKYWLRLDSSKLTELGAPTLRVNPTQYKFKCTVVINYELLGSGAKLAEASEIVAAALVQGGPYFMPPALTPAAGSSVSVGAVVGSVFGVALVAALVAAVLIVRRRKMNAYVDSTNSI